MGVARAVDPLRIVTLQLGWKNDSTLEDHDARTLPGGAGRPGIATAGRRADSDPTAGEARPTGERLQRGEGGELS
jgi:hypothetical protein